MDWPLPSAAPQPERTVAASYNKNLVGQDKLPFRQQDWIVHSVPQQPERTIAGSYNKNLIGQDRLPIRQRDWATPVVTPAQVQSWINAVNLALTTVVVPVLPLPLRPKDWPNPAQPAQPGQTWLNTAGPLTIISIISTAEFEWPNSEREFFYSQPDRSSSASFNKNLIGQDKLPFRQSDWPNPRDYQRSIQLQTWFDNAAITLRPMPQPTINLKRDWPLSVAHWRALFFRQFQETPARNIDLFPSPVLVTRPPTLFDWSIYDTACLLALFRLPQDTPPLNINLFPPPIARKPSSQSDWPLSSAYLQALFRQTLDTPPFNINLFPPPPVVIIPPPVPGVTIDHALLALASWSGQTVLSSRSGTSALSAGGGQPVLKDSEGQADLDQDSGDADIKGSN
jgi:hypothetical protein